VDLPIAADDEKCVRISEALDELARIDQRTAQVVKLHLFTGLELKEIATILGAAEKTIQRDWSFAKAWLSRELKSEK
jgi:DNA-directed RNA polymerase specialized sigma24 family protein